LSLSVGTICPTFPVQSHNPQKQRSWSLEKHGSSKRCGKCNSILWRMD